MRFIFALFAVAGAALATGFDGTWDATILAGGELVPFRLEVTESPVRVCFFEDTQPVCSTAARIEAGKLIAQWDYLNRELRLEVAGGGLQGVYRGLRTGHDLAVQAKPHQPASNRPQLAVDLAGDWEIHSKQRPALSWQLLLRQTGHELKGTILRVDGDDGTLVGTVADKHFLISHFSGDRPVMLEGTLADDGSLDLKFEGGTLFALRPAAARARNLPPPDDPATFARAKDPAQPFHFRLPDLNGRIYTEADFRGKPLIISITGSWCPNCRDEAPFLVELFESYHAAGLELAAFCFEPADDTDHAQLRAFLRRFAIPYPALLAGEPSSLKAVMTQIDHIGAYPTTIYIGRDGRVRTVHTGFPSAGSGEELTRVKREIRELVERMLAEPPVQALQGPGLP
ncbi:MAG: TlpA disulfide reductase family protein [Bryobacteraceae bacterium]